MNGRVYIETTVVSYLTAWPSRDLIRAAQQEITRQWWQRSRHDFESYISELVLIEAAAGDAQAANDRLAALRDFPLLEVTGDALSLADDLLAAAALPAAALRDAQHVGVAAVHGWTTS